MTYFGWWIHFKPFARENIPYENYYDIYAQNVIYKSNEL